MSAGIRRAIWLIAIVALPLLNAVQADESKEQNGDVLVALNGGRLAKVLAVCGLPNDVFASTDLKKNPTVCLDYNGIMFEVRKKFVEACYFFPPYQGTVFGCKMDDSPEQVVKQLGRAKTTTPEKDGKQMMLWNFKDQDQELQIDFKDKKCDMILVRIQ